jgi:DNA repair exonuclease SbcCD ATPase subunit
MLTKAADWTSKGQPDGGDVHQGGPAAKACSHKGETGKVCSQCGYRLKKSAGQYQNDDKLSTTVADILERLEEPMPPSQIDKSQLPDEVQEYLAKLETAVVEQEAEIEGLEEKLTEATKEPEPKAEDEKSEDDEDEEDDSEKAEKSKKKMADEEDDEDMEKLFKSNPQLAERIQKAEQRAEQAEKLAKAEQDARLTREYISKAKDEYNTVANAQEFGPVLKKLHELDEDTAAAVEKVLKGAEEMARKAQLFENVGKSSHGAGTGSTWDEVTKQADERVTKSGGKITREQAITELMVDSPELYDRYQAELAE